MAQVLPHWPFGMVRVLRAPHARTQMGAYEYIARILGRQSVPVLIVCYHLLAASPDLRVARCSPPSIPQ